MFRTIKEIGLALALILSFLLILMKNETAIAATIYVDGNVSDDDGSGTIDKPKKYITSGVDLLQSGDTLLIKDGVYTGAINRIGDFALPQVYPPSGSPGAYTIIKAEHEGQVILDGEYQGATFSNVNHDKIDYIRIEGIHFRRGDCGLFHLKGDYNKVIRSGFEDGQAPDDERQCGIVHISGNSHYSLVQDSWIWGKGRFGLAATSTQGGTDHIIFRRVVIRLDNTPLHGPTTGTTFYNGHDDVAQNVIVLDANINPDTTFINGGFGVGGSATEDAERNHSYYGVMSLHNPLYAGFAPYRLGTKTTIKDSVFWDNGDDGLKCGPTDEGIIDVSHVTVGKNGIHGFESNIYYDQIFWHISDLISVYNKEYGFNVINPEGKVNVFGNGSGACNNCSVTGAIETDPLKAAEGFSSPALKYLTRIEEGSDLKGKASDGGDIGATMLYRIGKDESLYGEPGWNDITSEPLWPWKGEEIWTPKIRAYNATGPGGDRGFASSTAKQLDGVSPVTFTSYIWEYLGNKMPSDIYGSNPPKFPPTASIIYSTASPTRDDVTATVTGSSVPISIVNNSGSFIHIFSENGSFTFQFKDNDGNIGSVTAAVNNIDRLSPVTSITPGSGSYPSAIDAILNSNESGSTYYTTDGSEPSSGSNIYTKPISIPSSSTLKYFSQDLAGNKEETKTTSYQINTVGGGGGGGGSGGGGGGGGGVSIANIGGGGGGGFGIPLVYNQNGISSSGTISGGSSTGTTFKSDTGSIDSSMKSTGSIEAKNFSKIKLVPMMDHFPDIEDSFAKDDINVLADRGIVRGYPDGTFRSDSKMTRSEFLVVAMKALRYRIDMRLATNDFADVKDGSWMTNYILRAKQLGIISGAMIGKQRYFRPDDPITRAEAVAILLKLSKYDTPPVSLSAFADIPAEGAWMIPYVYRARELGMITGESLNGVVLYRPKRDVTRAEAARMIVKTMEIKG